MLEEASRREKIDMGLLRRYHEDGDVLAREELAERCMPLVRSLARRYAGRGESLEDLVQAGTIGLVKAIDRFDLGSGHRFVSFAAPNIQGEIRRHFRDHTWAVHVPRSLQELDAKVQGAQAAILQETGREASDDDVAEALGITVDEVREAQAVGRSYRATSLDAPSGESREIIDTCGERERGYEHVEAAVVVEDAMNALKERDRRVLHMRFHEGLLQREIAERIGVSQMQVSRIIAAAVDRMGEHVRAGEPAPVAA
ncbi:unannotated protein [freshwater metagenome]|uniref:Unannotated protein n=1 Tax=freshwater metagenome TaxID=449393 RepID=A0A6J7IHV7_9ZZZZ|nr:SigB/SigF/SigG family RNA polymerase sigma factor [Actinomycetota bacterium]